MKVIKSKDIAYIPASHENPLDPEVWKKVLIDKSLNVSGKIMMVNWSKLPKNRQFQAHYHEDMTEVFIIIQGIVEAYIDKDMVQLSVGDTLVVEPQEVHTMKNITSDDVIYIVYGVAHGDQGKTINV